MRQCWFIIMLLASFALPALAASSTALPYNLTFSSGAISGSTFGGLTVTGTYTGTTSGKWTLTVSRQVFGTGTYACSGSTCTLTGTLAGKSVTFTLPLSSLSGSITGTLTISAFSTHGGWVSAVARWANTHLRGADRDKAISAAARIEGALASNGHNDGQANGQGNSHGRGRGK